MVIRSREIKYNKIIEVTPLHFTSCLDKKETILRHSFFINDEIESLSRFRLQTRGPKYQKACLTKAKHSKHGCSKSSVKNCQKSKTQSQRSQSSESQRKVVDIKPPCQLPRSHDTMPLELDEKPWLDAP